MAFADILTLVHPRAIFVLRDVDEWISYRCVKKGICALNFIRPTPVEKSGQYTCNKLPGIFEIIIPDDDI